MREPDGVIAWKHTEIRYSCPGCHAERVVDEEKGEQVCDRCLRVAVVEKVSDEMSPQIEVDLLFAQLKPHIEALHIQRAKFRQNGLRDDQLEVLVPMHYRAGFEGGHVFGLPIHRAHVGAPRVSRRREGK